MSKSHGNLTGSVKVPRFVSQCRLSWRRLWRYNHRHN